IRPDDTPAPPDPVLSVFGFDSAGERWLDHCRAAERSAPLGCIGPYDILEELGRGGQGVVYKAVQPGTGRVVAIKRILAGDWATSGAKGRFLQEVRNAARLQHPGIATIFAMDVVDGLPVYAMEWVD